MGRIRRLTSDEREDLVAYLDGELDDEAAQRIERVLAENPVARHEVDMLTLTWDLLDSLPTMSASREFTQRTLASIRVAEIRPPLAERRWFQHARRGFILAGWIAGLALSAYLGFTLTNRWITTEAEARVRDEPIVRNLDMYREVGDIDFLKRLDQSGLFDEKPSQSDR